MTAPSVRYWLDADAPVLTSGLGSLNNLLEKVLVDGYDSGNFPALGWTKEFEDLVNHKTVFRNSPSNGTGIFLRAVHHHASYAYELYGNVKMYEAMSDVDSGTGQFQSETRQFHISASSTITNATPWWIIGDNRRFFLVIHYYCYNDTSLSALRSCGNRNHASVNFFGDIISLAPIDSMPAVMGCANNLNTNAIFSKINLFSYGSSSYSNSYLAFSRDVFGNVGRCSAPCQIANSNESGYYADINSHIPNYPTFGYLNYSYTFLGCNDPVGSLTVAERSMLRGMIPGFRALGHNRGSFEIGQQIDISVDVKFLFFRGSSSANTSRGGCLIDIGTGWDQLPASIS